MALKQVRLTILAVTLSPLLPGLTPASAKERGTSETPVQVQQVYDCRAIVDPAARLACFDSQVAALEQAQSANDVTFFDRAAAQKARREGHNKMRFEIEDGAVWMQTDQTDLPRDPKPGEKIVIYPGAVGSYFAEIGNMKRIRVRRER